MPKSTKTKSSKRNVKVKNLPTSEKKLTSKEAKKVKGGILIGLLLPVKAPTALPGVSKQFMNTTFDDEA